MKSIMLTVITCTLALLASGQTDKLYKHNGQTENVKVVKVNEFTISFTYPGETAEQLIGKYAVAKIGYASGRTESISEKVVANGPDGWDNVMIIEDKGAVLGLKKIGDVRGKTSGLLSYNTAGSADKKASRKIKEAAAEMGAPFVLMISDKSDGFGVKQSIKNGVAYSYK